MCSKSAPHNQRKGVGANGSNANFIHVVSIYGLTCGQSTFTPTFQLKSHNLQSDSTNHKSPKKSRRIKQKGDSYESPFVGLSDKT